MIRNRNNAAPAEHPCTIAMQARYGHSRTVLLAQCCYNSDILSHIEDYAHFAEVAPRRAAALSTFHDAELMPNMQFYAARRSRGEMQIREKHPVRECSRLESRSITFCRELFNPDAE